MKFTLDYDPPASLVTISHHDKILLAGSCFAENIGKMMSDHRFQCTTNPGGIIFDAVSLARFLRSAVKDSSFTLPENQILERGGRFFSYHYHSSVSADSQAAMQQKHHDIIANTRATLVGARFLIITLGTAYTYFHEEAGIPVANCHKQPGSLFTREFSDPQKIIKLYSEILRDLKQLNDKLHIIFTVSPVKYLKDGPVNNNRSKSSLLLAVHKLVSANSNCSYFPAYELITDDLRDYRFYKEDLAHPNELAIRYVWEKFAATWFSVETRKINSEIGRLNKALSHRVLHANPEEQASLDEHISKLKATIRQLEPSLDL